jgi:hypothetical protein
MKSLLALVLLVGASSATNIKNRIQNTKNQFLAEAATGTTHTCQYSINRVNAGPADYKSIIAAGSKYTDASFPATSEMLRWTDRPGSDSLAQYSNSVTFSRLGSSSVWGSSTPSTMDIEQGQDADCYWLSAIGEEASEGRVQSYNFVTQSLNSAGIIAV